MKLVSLSIVRNEVNRYLRKPFLASLMTNVDKIYIYDDCSTDDTVKVCKEYKKVEVMVGQTRLWDRAEKFLRQNAWYSCREHLGNGDWVIIIDADEMILDSDYKAIREVMRDKTLFWIQSKFFHFWEKGFFRMDGNWVPKYRGIRIFKYLKNMQQQNLGGSLNAPTCAPVYIYNKGANNRIALKGIVAEEVRFIHLGYLKDKDKIEKYKRFTEEAPLVGNAHASEHINSILYRRPILQEFSDWAEVEKYL